MTSRTLLTIEEYHALPEKEGVKYELDEGELITVLASPSLSVSTKHVAEGIAVDYAADGRIAGIEILGARERLRDPEVFRRAVLEDVALARPADP